MNRKFLAVALFIVFIGFLAMPMASAQFGGGDADNNDDETSDDQETEDSDSDTENTSDSTDDTSEDQNDSDGETSDDQETEDSDSDSEETNDSDTSDDDSNFDGGDADNNEDETSDDQDTEDSDTSDDDSNFDGGDSENNEEETEFDGGDSENNEEETTTDEEYSETDEDETESDTPSDSTDTTDEDTSDEDSETQDPDEGEETDGETEDDSEVVDDEDADEDETRTSTTRSSSRTIYISPRSSSEEIEAEVNPDTIQIGESAVVSGSLTRGNTVGHEIEVLLNGNHETSVATDSDSSFEATVTPSEVGNNDLTLRSDNDEVTLSLYVTPTVRIDDMHISGDRSPGSSVDVCADISSQVDAEVTLYHNDQVHDSQTGQGELCFRPTLDDGRNFYRAVATVEGDQDEMEVRRIALSRPQRTTTTETAGGFFSSPTLGIQAAIDRVSELISRIVNQGMELIT